MNLPASARPILATLPTVPALVDGTVHHVRHTPRRHAFTYGYRLWLVDLDRPPVLPVWLRRAVAFRGEDHLAGEPGLDALKANVLRIAQRGGLDPRAVDRVVMLSTPRVFGGGFNPMSAFWCLDRAGQPVGIVVEVHNTYGERHAYVARPGQPGDAVVNDRIDKAFYVSPFNDTSGTYRVRARLSREEVRVAITLEHHGRTSLTAAIWGRPQPATTGAIVRTLAHHPLDQWRTGMLIRLHGSYLWLRRLPVQPRPNHDLESVR